MNKTLHLIASLVFIISLSGCTNRDTNVESETDGTLPEVIRVHEHKLAKKDVLLSSIFTEFEFIKLGNHQEGLFGNIDRIFFTKDRIFIIDFLISKKVLIFDQTGKFLNSISGLGKGPGEILTPLDFFIDTANSVIGILDAEYSIKKYSYKNDSFEFINLIDLPSALGSMKFAKINDRQLALIINGDYNLAIIDEKLKNIKYFFPYVSRNLSIGLYDGLNYTDNKIIFRKNANDTIYTLSGGHPAAHKIFRFNQPISYEKLITLSHSEQDNILKDFYIMDLYSENGNQFILSYFLRSELFFILRNSENTIFHFTQKSIVNDIFGYQGLFCIGIDKYTNSFIFQTSPTNLLNILKTKPEAINSRSLEMIKNLELNENDNLVLVKLKM